MAASPASAFHSAYNASLACRQVAPLFAPHSCRRFVDEYFEQQHLVTRATGGQALLSTASLYDAADHWQFKVAIDHSQARLLMPDSFAHDSTWTDGTVVDRTAMRAALAANRTLVLHNVELYVRPIGLLCRALMGAFGVYAQANVYYARAGLSSAVHAHQDAQSVFVVQCEGRKVWQLLRPPQRWRLRYNQRGKSGDVAPATELMEPISSVELAPGDVLFVPRGTYHRTSTLIADSSPKDAAPASLHVTIGVETDTDGFTWLALLRDAADALDLPEAKAKNLDAAMWNDERLREALPLRLCRYGGSFDASAPWSAAWLSRAAQLLSTHLSVRPDAEQLRAALDGALRTRQDHVEQKRLQLNEFLAMAPV
jgi:hypothetical protein